MRKLFFIASILIWHTSVCQIDSIYARIEIKSVSLDEHLEWIDTFIVITLEKFGRSEIISLGTIDGMEIGFQLALLKSRLGQTDLIINGKAYYLKKDGKWQMHSRPVYQAPEFKIASAKPLTIPDDYGMGGTTIQGLQIDYKEHYFIIR